MDEDAAERWKQEQKNEMSPANGKARTTKDVEGCDGQRKTTTKTRRRKTRRRGTRAGRGCVMRQALGYPQPRRCLAKAGRKLDWLMADERRQ